MDELLAALERSGKTTSVPEHIRNPVLFRLPLAGMAFFCSCVIVWAESSVPLALREAVVVSVLKPGKDLITLSCSYRPINLTSGLCKTMEIVINRCFVSVLESRNLYSA
jgi:potassium voltage-gated channel Eag-related subfamily H protein 8